MSVRAEFLPTSQLIPRRMRKSDSDPHTKARSLPSHTHTPTQRTRTLPPIKTEPGLRQAAYGALTADDSPRLPTRHDSLWPAGPLDSTRHPFTPSPSSSEGSLQRLPQISSVNQEWPSEAAPTNYYLATSRRTHEAYKIDGRETHKKAGSRQADTFQGG